MDIINRVSPNCSIKRELLYILEMCEKIAHIYGDSVFGEPLDESEIQIWENENDVKLDEELKSWLCFANGAVFKGLEMVLDPLNQFQAKGEWVKIGTFGNDELCFNEEGRIFRFRNDKKQNMHHISHLFRIWADDVKSNILAEEELQALRPVIDEEIRKLDVAQKRAEQPDAGIKEALEFFFAKDNVANLKFWRAYPHCPVHKNNRDCELIISEPNRDGYYQWQPIAFSESFDFSECEKELGFKIRPELKELFSSYYFFPLDGNNNVRIWPILPKTNIKMKVLDGFNKSNTCFEDNFICKGHFCSIGLYDEYELEFDNDTGAVYFWDFEEYRSGKVADSLFELIINMESIWKDCKHEFHTEYFLK